MPTNYTYGDIGQCNCSAPVVACSPCNIPQANLTLSWVNVISGNGSTTLTYTTGPTSWTSACVNGLMFKVLCSGSAIELRAIYFTSGTCPTGTSQYCSNLRSNPQALTLQSSTCSPLSITFKVTSAGCPSLAGNGYTQFTVTH